jgi:hypothetical protein
MECPRCGEDNLPGMARCFRCGIDLAAPAPVDDPVPLVPRVRTASPLRAGPIRKPRKQARFRVFLPRVPRRFVAMLGWGFAGLVPGLEPALRRAWREAAAWAAGLVVAALLLLLLWKSHLWPLAASASWILCGTTACRAAYARGTDIASGARFVAAFCCALMAVASARFAVAGLVSLRYLRVDVRFDQTYITRGSYLVDRSRNDWASSGTVVAWRQLGEGWYWNEPVALAPVLALPGQHVASSRRELLVDDRPVLVDVLVPGRAVFPTRDFIVPDGTVAILGANLEPVPKDEVLGPVTYRYLPSDQRGPYLPLQLFEGTTP